MINFTNFDLTSIRLFVAAAQEGSLTKAADRNNITLSAASKRLTDLEFAADCRLFSRHARGLEITPSGEALLKHALRLMNSIEIMSSEMDDFSNGVRGHVIVWANASSVIQFLPCDLSSFMGMNQDIKIGLEERLSSDIVKAVSEHHADIGIFADNVSSGELQTFTYNQDRLVLLVPNDHPLAGNSVIHFEEVLPYDFIGLNRGSSLLARLSEAASVLQRTLKLRIQVVSFDAICHMTAAGLGIGVIPEHVARLQVLGTELKTIPISDSWATRNLLLGVRSESDLRPEAKKLLDFLKKRGEQPMPCYQNL